MTGITAGANLFTEEIQDVSIRSNVYEAYHPIHPITSNSPIEFQLQGQEDVFLDLTSCFFDIKLQIKNADGTDLADAHNLILENGVLHNLFKDVQVFINSQLVSSSNGLSHISSYIQMLYGTNQSYKQVRAPSTGYYHVKGAHPPELRGNNLKGVINICGRFNIDVFAIEQLIPPRTAISLKLIMASSSYLLRKSLPDALDGQVLITSITLYCKKVQLISSLALAVEKMRSQGQLVRLLTPRVIATQRHLATGTLSFVEENFLSGTLPSKLALAFVGSSRLIGSYSEQPHVLGFYDLKTISLKINGIPHAHLDVSDSMPMLYEFTMHNLDSSDLYESGISLAWFRDGYGIIVFDLAGTDQLSPAKNGTIRLELQFGTALPNPVSLLCLSEIDSYITITNEGLVLLDTAP